MKRAVKHILTGICALGLAACIVMAFTAGAGARRSIRCTGLEVVVLDSLQNSFVSAKDVKGYIDREYGSYIGQAIDSIDLVRVEDIIDGEGGGSTAAPIAGEIFKYLRDNKARFVH